MSYISTEKGLERALEQTSQFYNDLEHIATDLGTLTKRYVRSRASVYHRSIDALDWDWLDDNHTPPTSKHTHRKLQQLNRLNNKNKLRRRLYTDINQTKYHESDHESLDFRYSTSSLRRSMKICFLFCKKYKENHFVFV